MATRNKSVDYWFDHLATANDNTVTSFSQITIFLIESGTKTFRSVTVEVYYADRNTTIASHSRRQIELQLAAAGFSAVNNTNTWNNSGENMVGLMDGDFTSYFTTNWSGTSMTCDLRVLVDYAGGSPLTPAFNNFSAKITINYDYDDTSASQMLTAYIPLDAPATALATSKPGTANAVIPLLNTRLAEGGKTVRQTTLVVEGNFESSSTTDLTLNMEVDTDGTLASQVYERGGASGCWYRINHVVSFSAASTHNFFIWGNVADFDHPHAYLCVTYQFAPASTTRTLRSLRIPAQFIGHMGGPTSSDYQRLTTKFDIPEGGTINTREMAFFMNYDKNAAIAGLNARVGTGSFVSYTDVASTVCGSAGLMIRNDSAFTLARGENELTVDVYRTDTVDLGFNPSGYWMINYEADEPTDGVGAGNHTVVFNIGSIGTTSDTAERLFTAVAPTIPESNYYINSAGVCYTHLTDASAGAQGAHVGIERLSGEGGLVWENGYTGLGGTDPEVGVRRYFGHFSADFFRRFVAGSVIDQDGSRVDIETSRRWRTGVGFTGVAFHRLDLYITYHSIEFTVGDDVEESAGGTVTIRMHDETTGERLMETSRTGNGAYSFTWFDNTRDMFTEARESGVLLARSDNGTATGSP